MFSCRSACPKAVIWVAALASTIAYSTLRADSPAASADWSGFRGDDGTGIARRDGGLSGIDRVDLRPVWKRPIGSGYSGIAIADGTVVTMFSDGTSDVAIALSEADGAERWRYEMGPTYVGHDGSHTGPISTPRIADGRVFGLSPRGRLFALALDTGREIWSTDLVADQKSKKPHYGFATSPILNQGVLVVEVGAKDAAVAGFDPATGKRLWTAGKDSIQYQSPIVHRMFDRRQVVAAGDKKLYGLDGRTGEILWEHNHGGEGARGVASLVPVPAGPRRLFLAYKDDASSVVEFTKRSVRPTGKRAWDSRSIRNSYNVPVYHDGYVYAYSSRFLTCVDAATGDSVWRSRKPGDGFLILVNDRLVIVTKKGSLHIAKASPSGYEELGSIELFDDLAWSNPSFADGHIFVRSLGEIARVDFRAGEEKVALRADSSEGRLPGSDFEKRVDAVRAAADKKSAVDDLMKSIDRFPFIEGRDRIHFVYRGPGDDLAVAGDMFGARQEREMNRVAGTDLFYYSINLEPDARVNYLFIKDYEELPDPNNSRKTTTAVYTKEMEMSFSGDEMAMSWAAMPDWTEPTHLVEPPKAKRGRLESRELDSKKLNVKLTAQVYVPAGYDRSSRRYPVAYFHGAGSAIERGKVPTMLDNLIGTRVEPIIAVFITFAPRGPSAAKYPEMFAEELIPMIDKTYRTVASAEGRANIGMGFGAYTAVLSTLAEPGAVGRVGCQSPFMFGSMEKAVKGALKSADVQPLRIYLDWGKYDLRNPHEAWDLGETSRRFAKLLEEKGYKYTGGEAHDGTGWSSWQNRTDDLLEALFPAGREG